MSEESKPCYVKQCNGKEAVIEIQQFVHSTLYLYFRNKFPTDKISGKFYQAIFEIQRSATESMLAGGMVPNGADLEQKLNRLADRLEAAARGGSIAYARRVLGVMLQVYVKFRREQKLSICGESVDLYIASLHMRLGIYFEKIVSQRGDASLIFAIDTTGSMTQEIKAAKEISQAIINGTRNYDVDYILSPFADPRTGPITHKSSAQKADFAAALGRLRTQSGGDCPELSMKGIRDAINFGPKYGSPMFVFTDASAKDGDAPNVRSVKMAADKNGVSLNFFMNPAGCKGDEAHGATLYKDLASHTGGQFFGLTPTSKLNSFDKFVAATLESDTILKTRSNAETSSTEIFVDRTMAKLTVAVSVEKVSGSCKIVLTNPQGKVVNAKTILPLAHVYNEVVPKDGKWKLVVSKACGKFEMSAKALSSDAITFNQNFFHNDAGSSRKRSVGGKVFSLAQPIIGRKTDVVIQMNGIERIDQSKGVKLHVLNAAGQKVGEELELTQAQAGKEVLVTSFTPPQGEFKFLMTGTTQAGLHFERESPQSMGAVRLFVQAVSAGDGFTAKAGRYAKAIEVVVNVYVSRPYFYSIRSSVDKAMGELTNKRVNRYINGMYTHTFQYTPSRYSRKGKTAKIEVIVYSPGEMTYADDIPILLM